MSDKTLSADRILDAAEDCLRRFGPQKTTVVDVARSLDVTHGAIYRHYASKEALREAVVSRWLLRDELALEAIASQKGSAADRLARWIEHLIESSRVKVLDEAELFDTYCELVKDMRNLRELIGSHLNRLQAQLAHIIEDGVRQKSFSVDDPKSAARAVFYATIAFHHPMLVKMRSECPHVGSLETEYRDVMRLIQAGLGLRTA